jgi:hypothetical protein
MYFRNFMNINFTDIASDLTRVVGALKFFRRANGGAKRFPPRHGARHGAKTIRQFCAKWRQWHFVSFRRAMAETFLRFLENLNSKLYTKQYKNISILS